jgi:signal transduction histidine kinase
MKMLLEQRTQEGGNTSRSTAELATPKDRVVDLPTRSTLRSQFSNDQSPGLQKPSGMAMLVQNFCHSMRTPLTSIKMRLYSLRWSGLPVDQEDDVDVIIEEIQYIEEILQGFNEFSHATKLRREKVSPSDIVDGALRLFSHHPESNGATINVHRQNKLPQISADTAKLTEALLNLLFNACEASNKFPVSISITEDQSVEKGIGCLANIRVKDNGIGIPESVQAKLFQPFFTTKDIGTGLGLSIAAGIVEAHGGLISFTSREGAGSTFTMSLPIVV